MRHNKLGIYDSLELTPTTQLEHTYTQAHKHTHTHIPKTLTNTQTHTCNANPHTRSHTQDYTHTATRHVEISVCARDHFCVFSELLPNRRRLPLQPDVCSWVVCVVGRARSDPPARGVYLGGFCRWGRPMRVFWVGLSSGGVWLGAREATLPRPPSPPQPARCVYLGWFCPRSGIDLIHYLRRKRLRLTGVRWYEMVI